jgi:hypothetical protein
MDDSTALSFPDFATSLRRLAYLLRGGSHFAESLMSTTLIKIYMS